MNIITNLNTSGFSLAHHDETLLDALERTGHQVEYQCRSGYCGACRVKLLDGEVEYFSEPLAYVEDDHVLSCCCTPKSNIRIDF